jgi:hypothetical protein
VCHGYEKNFHCLRYCLARAYRDRFSRSYERTELECLASSQTQTEPVAYRHRHHYRHYGGYHHRYYHRRYGWNPGAAVAGAALGLATVPFALATGGWPYYGHPYYGYYGGYYGPYYYY